jgi:radical SAM superfamily enzyme YgiQ (UPF0313 family)
MKILMIRPQPSEETIGLQHVMIVEPLELEVLGALRREHDEVVILDMIIERRPLEHYLALHRPDMVCVTGYITNVATMGDYCRVAKVFDPAIRTVVGGVHCEVCPGDLDQPGVDFRVVRNPVTVFPSLLEHIEGKAGLPAGVLLPGQPCREEALPELDFHYVTPDRSLVDGYRKHYFYIFHDKVALLKTSFGCPFTCNFCFCREITRGRYHQRPLEDTLDELEALPQKEIYIVDDDFLADRRFVTGFLDGLEARGIRKHYLIYGRADFVAENPDLVERFRDQGLRTVIVGFESFFEEELVQYDKNVDVQANRRAMEVLNGLDVDCFATIILNPHWDRRDFRRLEKDMKELGIHHVNLQPLTPLPGTGMKTDEESLLFSRTDYPKWDLAHLSIPPTRLSVADYYREILGLYQRTVLRPRFLLRHFRKYKPRMIWKMIRGSGRVGDQYRRKIAEAERLVAARTGKVS